MSTKMNVNFSCFMFLGSWPTSWTGVSSRGSILHAVVSPGYYQNFAIRPSLLLIGLKIMQNILIYFLGSCCLCNIWRMTLHNRFCILISFCRPANVQSSLLKCSQCITACSQCNLNNKYVSQKCTSFFVFLFFSCVFLFHLCLYKVMCCNM